MVLKLTIDRFFSRTSFNARVMMILAGVILCFFRINTGYTQVSLEINIISTFKAPGPSPQGLAWDGAYLWLSDDSTDTIYKINPQDGSVLFSFDSPGPEPKGLTSDTTHIWSLDDSLRYIYKLNKETGAVIDSISFPVEINYLNTEGLQFHGLTWDGRYFYTNFKAGWSSSIIRINPNDSEVDISFFCDAEDLAFDGACLWCVDSQDGHYKGFIEKRELPYGTRSAYFRTPGYYPTGLTFDGNYLWITDNGTDSLYKIQILTTYVVDINENDKNIPNTIVLKQNYPNPFNGTTTISYTIQKPSNVCLTIIDIAGREVITLVNEEQTSGIHRIVWNGKDWKGGDVPSGLYFYHICLN